VLTHRIAWMLNEEQVPAWQVLAVTFTNKAAREMGERLNRMVTYHTAQDMTLGTFHATCARILRREAEHIGLSHDYLIFDSDDQIAVMKEVIKELGLDDKQYRPRAMLNAISRAKNELIPVSDYEVQTYYDEVVSRVYAHYQEILRRSNGVDFDDLLMETAMLFRHNPDVLEQYRNRYRHILVDEFQDTNMAQYVILKLLSRDRQAQPSLFVVADEDQSIYSWRGADYRNIQRLREDYPELREYLLEENYRSTQVILDAAQSIIAGNHDRTPKRLFTRKEGGALLTLHEAYDEEEEADYIAREVQSLLRRRYTINDIAVMYRTNAQSRAIEEAFIRYNLPYRLIGGTRFYARKEIKDLLAYLRLAQNPDDDVSFQRVVNVPSRGIGSRTLGSVIEHAREIGSTYYVAAMALIQQQALTTRTRRALHGFVTMVMDWYEARQSLTIVELMDYILSAVGYESTIRDGSEEGESRWENILALKAVAADFPDKPLIEFLTDVALVSDVDELSEQVKAVTLLTLHSAKGLEYPVVFVTGLEEGLLPHSRSMDSLEEIAEERRLCYVGMTRAQEKLYLTYAFRRGWGRYSGESSSEASRFLQDLPDEVLDKPQRARKSQTVDHSRWSVPSWERPQANSTAKPNRSPNHRPSASRAQDAQRAPSFKRGQRVRHAHYGEGIVLESQLDRRDEIVTVIFTGVGIKQLLVGVAPMEPLSEH
jgi:DNA helicase II / ATP-dependent DNA helicase PcrA